MSKEVDERVAKLVDPEHHFAVLAGDLRKKLVEVQKAYAECVKYGLVGDFYTGPAATYTYLPDTVRLKKIKVSNY